MEASQGSITNSHYQTQAQGFPLKDFLSQRLFNKSCIYKKKFCVNILNALILMVQWEFLSIWDSEVKFNPWGQNKFYKEALHLNLEHQMYLAEINNLDEVLMISKIRFDPQGLQFNVE